MPVCFALFVSATSAALLFAILTPEFFLEFGCVLAGFGFSQLAVFTVIGSHRRIGRAGTCSPPPYFCFSFFLIRWG